MELASAPKLENDPTVDPFSSDVFGVSPNSNASDTLVEIDVPIDVAVGRQPSLPTWAAKLPRVSRKLLESPVRENTLPEKLPDSLAKAIRKALNDVVFAGAGHIHCALESIAECDLTEESKQAATTGNLAIQVTFEPTESYASVVVGGGLVHQIIDEIFGTSGDQRSNKISPIETAIVEFLAARVVGEMNESLGAELFSVGEATLSHSESFKGHKAGVKARIDLRTDTFSRSFRILMSQGFLSGAINAAEDLDADEPASVKPFSLDMSVSLRAEIGSTRLDAATLSFLEPGDVVIVEESGLKWIQGSLRGPLRMFAGTGHNFVLTGELNTNKNAEAGTMQVLLKNISSREAMNGSYEARFVMEEKKQVEANWDEENGVDDNYEAGAETEEESEISASLENLQLRLRVELGGKKISLREIKSLRAGQVINLERSATDSVNLVTDGSDETVAIGELVDIEGRLGVRIIRVFL